MARSRNIKPGFFTNEILVELPFAIRLLFIGLWTLADREGRLEDRPKRIKMELFPCDEIDVDASLQSLHENGFIRRYEVDGERYVSIVNWHKHQNPHVKEAASIVPPPPEHHTSTILAPCQHDTGTMPAVLIPDSGILIPDSGILIPGAAAFADDTPAELQEKGKFKPESTVKDKPEGSTIPKPRKPPKTLEEIIASYGEDSPHRALKEIEILYGDPIPYFETQANHMKRLLATKKWTWQQAVDCWKFKSDQKNGCWIEIAFVAKDIADFVAGRLPGQKGQINATRGRSGTEEISRVPGADAGAQAPNRSGNVAREAPRDFSRERELAAKFDRAREEAGVS